MNDFLRLVRQIRYCWICGRYGGGKTTLALMLADMLVKGGHVKYVVSNTPLMVDAPMQSTFDERSLTEIQDAVIVLDEAGVFLEDGNKRMLRQWFAYLRHRNQIILMPSVMPVVRYASMLRCQRMFNGLQMGVPVWIYRWELRLLAAADKGYFGWWNPAQVFGLFDTEYDPTGEWFIYDFGNVASEEGTTGEEGDAKLGSPGVGVGIDNAIPAFAGAAYPGWDGG